jgi:hypothetical protein
MNRFLKIWIPIFIGLFLLACQSNETKKSENEKDKFDGTEPDKALLKDQMDVVFYNLFSPVDLAKIVDKQNSKFNSSFINPIENLTLYNNSYKIALNLGVYGADLSYLWAFDQTQQSLNYLAAVKQLTDKLGIPGNFVDFTVIEAETISGDMDSLINIARKAYLSADRYLKNNRRENAAAMILLGGWVETLYIALNLYTTENPTMASKILSQKYSLNSLLLLIQNHEGEINIAEYILLLKKLNEQFQKLESLLKPGNIHIDTVKKVISIKESANLQIPPEAFKEIADQVALIRRHIIE